jgi:flagellar hook-associated protein 1
MAGMTSFGTVTAGLKAAQAGLYVTGHNMSNSLTPGYSRQRIIQSDNYYQRVGVSSLGSMQVGLGTSVASIQQTRNRFLDMNYRQESPRAGFHSAMAETGMEMDSILGGIHSVNETSSVINRFSEALHELVSYASGVDTRGAFIESAISFIGKANDVGEKLIEYQRNLDQQVRDTVKEINSLVKDIDKLNKMIVANEISGDNANDFRDSRNYAIDRLSELINIKVFEMPNGSVDIMSDGNEILKGNFINKIGLKYCAADYSFVEPVFTHSDTILPFDTPPAGYKEMYSLTGKIDANHKNDKGLLKGLLVSRGIKPANYKSPDPAVAPDINDLTKYPATSLGMAQYKLDKHIYDREVFNANEAFVPSMQKEFDRIIHSVIVMMNDALAPYKESTPGSGIMVADYENAPFGLHVDENGRITQFTELFVRKNMDRFTLDADGYPVDFNKEDANNIFSLYTIGNIEINPLFLDAFNYDLLPFSLGEGVDNQRSILEQILKKWDEGFTTVDGVRHDPVNEGYRVFVSAIGTKTEESITFMSLQIDLLQEIDYYRMQVSSVSMDEEVANMMKYRHAYNAASRMISVIDSMLDKLVNGTGRVGL